MKTKLISLLVALCAASNLFAADFEYGGLLYNITSSYTVEVTYQTAWSVNYEGLTSVTIPATVINNGTTYSVTSIGYRAFQSCTGLTSVTFPNSVTSIGNEAFSSCTGLTSITIPNSVTSIGESAFRYCNGLTSVTIGNSVTSIGNGAFLYCKGLTSITIPNSVTSIGENAFYHCTGLTSITIPKSVTSIGESAFNGCTGLTSIVVESGNTVYDSRENCNAIIETATNTLTHGCQTTIIPNSVTSIGSSAFSGCTVLTSITIPESVTSIGDGAFWYCYNLTSITIPKSITSIGGWVFDGCQRLTSVVWNAKNCDYSFGWYDQYEGYSPFSTAVDNITLFTLGNEVDSIPYFLCYGMSKLTTITIPKSVTSIGDYAFYGCTGLTSIVVESGNTVYDSRENCNAIIETATNTLIQGCQTTIIPNSVTSIGSYTFSGCTGLTSITIPNSVTSIGNCAFSGCTGLTSVTIPNSVTSIGYNAFYDIPNIVYNGTATGTPWGAKSVNGYVDGYLVYADATKTSLLACYTTAIGAITIPNSVTNIGNRAFSGCTGLTTIDISNSITSIGEEAFYNCTGLTTVVWNAKKCGGWNKDSYSPFYSIKNNITSFTFGVDVESIPAYLCYGMSKLTAITIPNSVTSIGDHAFYNCKGLTSITIPNSVTYLSGFSGCTGLTSITIPNSVTSIGDDAFYGCTGLTSITIPNSVKSIGERAFSVCKGLTSVTIPNSVKSIGEYAFGRCTGLTAITIPNSVTSIRDQAFRDCTGLTSITIPNNVTSIGSYTFSGCTGLTSIQVEAQTPPKCDYRCFYRIPQDISVYVPCGTSEAYHATDGWSSFTNIIEKEHDYIVVVRSSNEDYGTATIISYTCNELTIQATANEHYHFTQWSDGSTDNLRTFMVVQDTAITAVFAPNQYSISVSAEYGSVQGAGKYDYGTMVTLTAIANEHYHFVQWSDGNTTNPRSVIVEGDATYTAVFAVDKQYTVTATCDIRHGIVTGSGSFYYGTQVTLQAIPNSGYEFKQWSNGLTYNPYRFTVLDDLTIEAVFISSSATALEDTPIDTITPQKVLRNGQVYILRGGKTYTLMGVEVE